MQRRATQVRKPVIVVHAEDYIPGRLPALVANGLNQHAYIGAHPAVGTAALADSEVIVAIDGMSEIPRDTRTKLGNELKQFLPANPRAALVLAGRETTAMRSVLSRSTTATDLVVTPLSEDEQQQLVDMCYECGSEIAAFLVSEANRKMQTVAKNPLMLLLGVRAIILQGDAANPARVFETVIRAIADECGYPDASVFEIGLGMAYNRLLDKEKRYTDTLTWSKILKEVAEQLAAEGYDISGSSLREFGSETGLVRVAQLDSVRPVHDSFADYLAAAAVSKSMATLPTRLGGHDRSRARYLAQLSGIDSPLAELLTRDLPLTAVSVLPYEDRSPDESWLEETQLYVDRLLPTSASRPNVAYWVDDSGGRVVTVDGELDGWWESSEPQVRAIGSGWTFRLTGGQGPLFVAVQIWRRCLDKILTAPTLSRVAVPHSLEESKQLLTVHSNRLHERLKGLMQLLELPEPETNALAEITDTRMQFVLSGEDRHEERERGVWFRDASEILDGGEVLVGHKPDDATWTGWGRVDSFVSTGPLQSAARIMRNAINKAVGRTWL